MRYSLGMRALLTLGLSIGLTLGACASDSDKPDKQSPAKPHRDAGGASDGGSVDSGTDAGPGDAGTRDAGPQDAEMPMVSCEVQAPTACVEPKPTYADVTPIIKERCLLCHNGQAGGPWPLSSYGHVADWQNEIRDQVSKCIMPPPDAGVPITTEEREKILMWIRCGLQH